MSHLTRRTLLGTAGGLALGAAVPVTARALPQNGGAGGHGAVLHRWARDTWHSMVAMTDPRTGLIADNIDGRLRTRSGYTSPTNIGGYLWSTIVAHRLGLISEREATRRAEQTLETLLGMERHRPSGMFYNWYDEATGDVLRSWPDERRSGRAVRVQRRHGLAGRRHLGGSQRVARGAAQGGQVMGRLPLGRVLRPGLRSQAGRELRRLLHRGPQRHP